MCVRRPTPFCRSGDGRTVLRSSVREFLASEAMHHLRVPTTRALSVLVSQSETSIRRPMETHLPARSREEQSAITCRVAPSFIRIGHFELLGRRAAAKQALGIQLEEQLPTLSKDDLHAVLKYCQIPHPEGLELSELRARGQLAVQQMHGQAAGARGQLKKLVRHAARREFADQLDLTAPIGELSEQLIHASATRIAEW